MGDPLEANDSPASVELERRNSLSPYFFSASACSFYVLEIIVIIVIFKGYYFKVQVLFDS